MKLVGRDIKDKRIEVAGPAFIARVELWCGRLIGCGRHLTLVSAQKALAKYPPDVFEGYDNPAKMDDVTENRKPAATAPPPTRRKNNQEYTRLYDRRIL
jgi:hypothetical protein